MKINLDTNNDDFTYHGQTLTGASTSNYGYYKNITILSSQVNGSGSHSNFPVLISLNDTDLRDQCQADGDDIAFYDGTTLLDYEIEYYGDSIGKLVAWVRIPTLSTSSNTIIRMYYGNPSLRSSEANPTDVWINNFQGVWHLGEISDTTSRDSTLNSFDGTHIGDPTSQEGIMGNAYYFDGDDMIQTSADSSDLDVDGNKSRTVSVWTNQDDAFTNYGAVFGLAYMGSGTFDDFHLFTNIEEDHWLIDLGGTIGEFAKFDPEVLNSHGSWMLHTIVYIGGRELLYYANGQLLHNYTLGTQPESELNTNNNYSLKWGSTIWNNVDYNFTGIIDEARILNTICSADWIATEYNNQNDPSSFCTIGSALTNPGHVPTLPTNPNEIFYCYKNITIDHNLVNGTASLVNYPMLISLLDEDLHHFTQTDGDDIAFYQGTTLLDHEIEIYNQNFNTTHAKLITWVRIPSLSTTQNTEITIYFGNSTMISQENPTGVWDEDFIMVNHLSGDSYLNLNDSTSNNNDVSSVDGTPMYGVTGKINNAVLFNNNDKEGLIVPDSPSLDITANLTLSAWINPASVQDYDRIISKSLILDEDPERRYGLLYDDDKHLSMTISDDLDTKIQIESNTQINQDQWYYVAGTVNDTTMTIFLNGNYENHIDSTVTIGTNDVPLTIGMAGYPGNHRRHFDGILDEVRVSKNARSAGWIATEFNNQNDPDSFYSIGPLFEFAPPTTTIIINTTNSNYLNGTDLITFSPVDHFKGTGINSTFYRLNGESWINYTGPFNLNDGVYGEGNYTIDYYSIDNDNHIEIFNTRAFYLDKTLPACSIDYIYWQTPGYVNSSTLFNINVMESGSGIDKVFYNIDGRAWEEYTTPFDLYGHNNGPHTINYYCVDKAGNKGTLNSVFIIYGIEKIPETPPDFTGIMIIFLLIGIITVSLAIGFMILKKSKIKTVKAKKIKQKYKPPKTKNTTLNEFNLNVNLQIICPICKAHKKVKIPKATIDEAKSVATISIPKDSVCSHHFQAFVDKNLEIRGYQRVDVSVDPEKEKAERLARDLSTINDE